MKRFSIVMASLVLLAVVVVGYRTLDACARWQDTYKRFLYSEMIQNSPIVMKPAMIDEMIGEPPSRCDRPETLSHEDSDRYRREGVGPNEFLDEWRAAYRRTDGFKNL